MLNVSLQQLTGGRIHVTRCLSRFRHLRNNSSHMRFLSSSDESQSSKLDEEKKSESSPEPTKANPVVFPWRHEEQPLPRLVQGTPEYETQGQLLSSVKAQTGNVDMNMFASAFMFLDVPVYQFLFFGSWKGELADSMSWAFTQGVAGLLSNLISTPSSKGAIPMDKIIQNTYELKFHAKIEKEKSDEQSGEKKRNEDEGNDDETTENKESSNTNNAEAPVPLEKMFEQKVIDFFREHIQSVKKETEICLETVPYSAELISLYAIPYISRQNTKHDKELLSFYRKMMDAPSMERTADLNKLRKEKLESGIMESTVIAQVLLRCNEVFFVKDTESGEVLQGVDNQGTSTSVHHLVRLESRVKTMKDAGSFRNIQDDWIITDIDDLLHGNLIL